MLMPISFSAPSCLGGSKLLGGGSAAAFPVPHRAALALGELPPPAAVPSGREAEGIGNPDWDNRER